MSITTKPIKRSRQLIPLSREHHDGLLLCWKIRAGFRNDVSVELISSYVQFFYETNLSKHFRDEEEILFPLLPDNDLMTLKALEQHKNLETIILRLRTEPVDKENLLYAFAEALENHIRFEERELYGHIEKTTETDKLDAAGRLLDAKHEELCQHIWKDEFWNRKN